MKKQSILALALCSLSFMGFAAPTFVETTPQKKTVVLEEYTGIGCVNCPFGHLAANKTSVKYPKTVLINIHQGSYAAGKTPDLVTPFGDALFNQTGAPGYPAGTLNRQVLPPSKVTSVANYTLFPDYATTIVSQDAYLNVAAQSSIDWTTRLLTVNVEVYYTDDSPANVNFLNVALLQSNIMGPQTGMENNPAQVINGKYQHNHALRNLITGQWGDSITTTTQGSFFSKTYTYTIPSNIKKVDCVLEDMEVVVFVAQSRQNIINGAKSSMAYVNQPPLYASLTEGGQLVLNSCDSAVNGYVKLLNKGADSIVSAKFMVTAGLDTVEYDWTADKPIKYNEIDSISLTPVFTIPNMTRRFTVKILALNGEAYGDSMPANSIIFNVLKKHKNGIGNLKLTLNHDRYGSETTWSLYGPDNTVVASGGPYEDLKTNTTEEVIVNIPITISGCYYFEIKDAVGDGINNGRGTGNYNVTDVNGATLITSNGKYGFGEVTYLTMQAGNSIEGVQNQESNISLYPIPATNELTINSLYIIEDINIYNMTGQLIRTVTPNNKEVSISLDNLNNGIYVVKVNTEKGLVTKKFIIKK